MCVIYSAGGADVPNSMLAATRPASRRDAGPQRQDPVRLTLDRRTPARLKRAARRPLRRRRAGAAMVEMALTLPLFLAVVLGIIEFGRAFMVEQVVTNAAREGARHGVLPGVTAAAAVQKARDHLAAANLNVPQATVTISPSDLSTARTGSAVTVTVAIPYSAVSWVTVSWFLRDNAALRSQCVMRHE